jgi:hypothetical protein
MRQPRRRKAPSCSSARGTALDQARLQGRLAHRLQGCWRGRSHLPRSARHGGDAVGALRLHGGRDRNHHRAQPPRRADHPRQPLPAPRSGPCPKRHPQARNANEFTNRATNRTGSSCRGTGERQMISTGYGTSSTHRKPGREGRGEDEERDGGAMVSDAEGLTPFRRPGSRCRRGCGRRCRAWLADGRRSTPDARSRGIARRCGSDSPRR